MRRPTKRLQRDVVVLYHRSDTATTGRGAVSPTWSTGLPVKASFQPLGDTGRRMDRSGAQMRLGGEDSWRVWFAVDDARAAGLEVPYCKTGDRIEYAGRSYIVRAQPIPQRREHGGTVLSYSVDVDGVI